VRGSAMLVAPDSREMVMARLRKPTLMCGLLVAVRTWQSSMSDPVQPVLDGPVAADGGRELGVGGLGDGQRGNRVAGFAGLGMTRGALRRRAGSPRPRQRLGHEPVKELFSQVAVPVADEDTPGTFLGP
jgi:hypothetical protein